MCSFPPLTVIFFVTGVILVLHFPNFSKLEIPTSLDLKEVRVDNHHHHYNHTNHCLCLSNVLLYVNNAARVCIPGNPFNNPTKLIRLPAT